MAELSAIRFARLCEVLLLLRISSGGQAPHARKWGSIQARVFHRGNLRVRATRMYAIATRVTRSAISSRARDRGGRETLDEKKAPVGLGEDGRGQVVLTITPTSVRVKQRA